MTANNNFIRYEEKEKFETYAPSLVNSKDLYSDIRNEMKAESQLFAGFMTIKNYSNELKNI